MITQQSCRRGAAGCAACSCVPHWGQLPSAGGRPAGTRRPLHPRTEAAHNQPNLSRGSHTFIYIRYLSTIVATTRSWFNCIQNSSIFHFWLVFLVVPYQSSTNQIRISINRINLVRLSDYDKYQHPILWRLQEPRRRGSVTVTSARAAAAACIARSQFGTLTPAEYSSWSGSLLYNWLTSVTDREPITQKLALTPVTPDINKHCEPVLVCCGYFFNTHKQLGSSYVAVR